MAAAAAAAENGATVLVLEKAASIGGNTKLGEGTYNVADPERQKQLTMTADNCKEVEAALNTQTDDPEYQALIDATRADYEKWQAEDGKTLFDSPNWHALQTYIGGGYAASSDLVYKYSNGAITTKLTSCAATSTGDGLALAENVGGSLINLDQIQVHPLGDPIDDCGCVSEFVGNWLSATEYMFVNKEGKRFINEDNTRYAISMAELQQTDGQMWLIVDSSAIAGDDSRNELIDKLLNDGHSVKANTLDELAEKIGVDADTLKATVEAYNAGMTSGKDAFGKATSADSTILQAPFYASLRTPTVHYTMGGIQIDTGAHVLDADGNAIPGLYAAGEVASGIHGNNRLGGNAYPDIITRPCRINRQGLACFCAQIPGCGFIHVDRSDDGTCKRRCRFSVILF